LTQFLIDLVEPVKIRSFQHDPATQRWLWSEPINIEIHKGSFIKEGGFRKAYRCTFRGYDQLSNGLFVLKTFLEDAVQERMEDLLKINPNVDMQHTVKELNQKVS